MLVPPKLPLFQDTDLGRYPPKSPEHFRFLLLLNPCGRYVRRQNGERMIFVSDTLQGAFGAAWRFASGSKGSERRKRLGSKKAAVDPEMSGEKDQKDAEEKKKKKKRVP